MYKGSVELETPMLYALGFIGLFTIGGLTGLFLATFGMDVHLTETYFVIAHFHYIMVGGAIMAYIGGIHFWWPKITGRMYPEFWGRISAGIIFMGFNLTFFPQFVLGYLGMPRRYHAYPPEFQMLNVLSTAGASILAVGYVTAARVSDLVAQVWRRSRATIRSTRRASNGRRLPRRRRLTSTRCRSSLSRRTRTTRWNRRAPRERPPRFNPGLLIKRFAH